MKKLFSIIALLLFVAGMGFAQNNHALVDQNGNTNEAKIDQIGSAHEAFIYQTGNDNEAEIKQTHDRNWAEVRQHNDDNKVFIDQVWGSDNIAQIKQMGSQEHTYFRQQGNDNIFRLRQQEGHNKVGLDADNPFIQLGDHNKFAGVTNGDGLAFDQDGYAMQFNGAVLDPSSHQTGDYNQIGLYQDGLSTGTIKQDGHNNTALLWQVGEGNTATIIQNNNWNSASVTQVGDGNTAIVTQGP